MSKDIEFDFSTIKEKDYFNGYKWLSDINEVTIINLKDIGLLPKFPESITTINIINSNIDGPLDKLDALGLLMLQMVNCSNITCLSNLKTPNLGFIKVNRCPKFNKIVDCDLPNLTKINVHVMKTHSKSYGNKMSGDKNIFSLENVHAPKLKEIPNFIFLDEKTIKLFDDNYVVFPYTHNVGGFHPLKDENTKMKFQDLMPKYFENCIYTEKYKPLHLQSVLDIIARNVKILEYAATQLKGEVPIDLLYSNYYETCNKTALQYLLTDDPKEDKSYEAITPNIKALDDKQKEAKEILEQCIGTHISGADEITSIVLDYFKVENVGDYKLYFGDIIDN
ncbi:MAG: hypothetical protein HRU35_03470 [Rickettsiaceae bacterium]|nr:hypothetical protein [Rickettsiaceae bacterium]